jgi:hypothetical protein
MLTPTGCSCQRSVSLACPAAIYNVTILLPLAHCQDSLDLRTQNAFPFVLSRTLCAFWHTKFNLRLCCTKPCKGLGPESPRIFSSCCRVDHLCYLVANSPPHFCVLAPKAACCSSPVSQAYVSDARFTTSLHFHQQHACLPTGLDLAQHTWIEPLLGGCWEIFMMCLGSGTEPKLS